MIVTVNKQQAAALCLHMNTMRNSMKKVLKKKYKEDRAEYLKAYDYVKFEAANAVETQTEQYVIHCNIVDVNVLEAFLAAYIDKTKAVFEQAKLKDADEHLEALQAVLEQCEVLKSA